MIFQFSQILVAMHEVEVAIKEKFESNLSVDLGSAGISQELLLKEKSRIFLICYIGPIEAGGISNMYSSEGALEGRIFPRRNCSPFISLYRKKLSTLRIFLKRLSAKRDRFDIHSQGTPACD